MLTTWRLIGISIVSIIEFGGLKIWWNYWILIIVAFDIFSNGFEKFILFAVIILCFVWRILIFCFLQLYCIFTKTIFLFYFAWIVLWHSHWCVAFSQFIPHCLSFFCWRWLLCIFFIFLFSFRFMWKLLTLSQFLFPRGIIPLFL